MHLFKVSPSQIIKSRLKNNKYSLCLDKFLLGSSFLIWSNFGKLWRNVFPKILLEVIKSELVKPNSLDYELVKLRTR